MALLETDETSPDPGMVPEGALNPDSGLVDLPAETGATGADILAFLARQPNIVDYVDDRTLTVWGQQAREGYEIDLESIAEWRNEVEEIRKMASAPKEDKNYPWPDASNIRYPLITVAALQFNARAYPTIVNNGNIALAKVLGEDPEGQKQGRADRVSRHMSYQLTEEMDEWDDDMDKLLLALPLDGCAFKKVFRDPALGRNVSQYVVATDLVVNSNTMSLLSCPRISHILSFYPHEIKEKINLGVFQDKSYGLHETDPVNQEPREFVEQHTWFDLDEDGYPEPYIITFETETGDVARVRANFRPHDIHVDSEGSVVAIEPRRFFVKYECFPDPEGGFYGKGFGQLLKPLNDATDSLLNQLIDAGHLANTGGGFIAKTFRVESGTITFSPGHWEKVDTAGLPMKDAVMPLPVPEPSTVLFQLLGLLVDAGKEIASIQDVMTGGGGQNTPATTVMAMIEQGMKVYTSIFKRIYRSLRKELILLYELNGEYLDARKYRAYLDDPEADAAADYNDTDMDIRPAADPSMATDIQKAAKSQILNQYLGIPGIDVQKVVNESLRAAGFSDPEQYWLPPSNEPTPEEIKIRGELEIKRKEAFAKLFSAMSDALEKAAKTDEMGANNALNMQELLLLFREFMNYETGRSSPMEGGQPMVPGAPPGPQGGVGTADQ